MMKYTALLICFGSLFFAQCITTSLPQVVIPEKAGQGNASASLGTNGLHLNAMYATKFRLAVLGSFDTNGGSTYGELSLGIIQEGNWLITAGFGHGKFNVAPLIYGGTYGVYDYWGHFFPVSLRVNKQFGKRFGMINSLMSIQGTDNGDCPLHCDRFNNRKFSAVYYEPVFYLRGRKHKNRYFTLGGAIPIKTASPDFERAFGLSPFNFGFGVCLSTRKEKS